MRIAFFLNSSLIILASVAATLGQELESVKLDEVRLSRTPHAKFALHPDGNLIAVFGVDNYLLEGLRGKADLDNDYTVTVGELMDFVEDQVNRETNGNQRPLRSATVFDYELPMSVLQH